MARSFLDNFADEAHNTIDTVKDTFSELATTGQQMFRDELQRSHDDAARAIVDAGSDIAKASATAYAEYTNGKSDATGAIDRIETGVAMAIGRAADYAQEQVPEAAEAIRAAELTSVTIIGSVIGFARSHVESWFVVGEWVIPDTSDEALDRVQLVLDGVGLIPVVGELADGANALISLVRGNYLDAGLSAISMIPLAGDAIGKGGKLGIFLLASVKYGDEVVDAAKISIRVADPKAVLNVLSNFRARRYFVNGQNLKLDKAGLKHILERHHPRYWDGTVKQGQSFFPKNMPVSEVENAITEVLKQNPGRIAEIGENGIGTMTGVVTGVTYQLGINRGRIGQFFIVP